MTCNEFNFSKEELKTFFSRKKTCPNCGSRDLNRTVVKNYEGTRRSRKFSANLMHEEVYNNIIIYECQSCKRKYTLEGLNTGEVYLEQKTYDVEREKEIIKFRNAELKKAELKKARISAKRFFDVWLVFTMLILISVAWDEKSLTVMIFSPVIVFVYFVIRFFIIRK